MTHRDGWTLKPALLNKSKNLWSAAAQTKNLGLKIRSCDVTRSRTGLKFGGIVTSPGASFVCLL